MPSLKLIHYKFDPDDLYDARLRVLFRRSRHLKAWCDLTRQRITSLQSLSHIKSAWKKTKNSWWRRLFQNSRDALLHGDQGLASLISYTNGLLDEVDGNLDIVHSIITGIMDSPEDVRRKITHGYTEQMWIYCCGAAENSLNEVEAWCHPLLASRTPSDHQYDRVLSRLIYEIAPNGFRSGDSTIRIVPVTSHRMRSASPASTRPYSHGRKSGFPKGNKITPVSNDPIVAAFCFYPSIRSLTSLMLMYHELGHTVWSVGLSSAKKIRLTRMMNEAFPEAFQSHVESQEEDGKNEWIDSLNDHLASEIFADCFASLVGGYAYAATLCGTLLTKSSIWKKRSPAYLSVSDRVMLTQLCSETVSPNCSGSSDSFFDGFFALRAFAEKLTQHSKDKHKLFAPGLVQTGNKKMIIVLANAVMGELMGSGVKLVEPMAELDAKGSPNVDGLSHRDILSIAAQYRDKCPNESVHYVKWERRVLKKIGISVSGEIS